MSKPNSQPTSTRDPSMTLAEIAERMGMSRERVRQIEESALRKARKVLRKRGMTAEDFFSTLKYNQPIKTDPNAPESAYELITPERETND